MKGFTQHVEGPLGPWYLKVNAEVSRAQESKTSDQLREILGEPDIIEPGEYDDECEPDDVPVDEAYPNPKEYWVYVDPYRPRIRYLFGLFDGRIVETTKSIQAG